MGKRINWLLFSIAALLVFTGIMYGLDKYDKNYYVPRLYIRGDISKMEEKTDVRRVLVEYRDNGQEFTAYAKLKVQGTSSLYYKKKNYTLNFFEEDYVRRRTVDFGWGDQSKYCLKANWVDKTHARNLVTARLATEIQQKYGLLDQAPKNGLVDGYPVEVYANGKFHGLYTMNIPKDAWTFAMDESNPDHLVFCGQLWEPATLFEGMPDYGTWTIEVGEPTGENLQKLNRLFAFVINSSDEEFKANFAQYLNLDATLHYMILCDLAQMRDNYGKNILLVTYDGKLWYPNLYDMDTSWGTNYDGRELYDYTDLSVSDRNNLFRRVRDNFSPELAQRYFELRETVLSRAHIMEAFQNFTAEIPARSLAKEKDRWGTPPGFGYDQIEEFLDVRLPLLDEYMEGLRG